MDLDGWWFIWTALIRGSIMVSHFLLWDHQGSLQNSFRAKKPNRETNFEWFWSSRGGIYWWILMVDGSYESWCYGDNCMLVTFYSNTYHIARRAKNRLSTNPKIGFLAFFRVKLNLPRMKPFLPKNIGLTWGFWFSGHFLQHPGTWSNLQY